jgi:hypothetical protein
MAMDDQLNLPHDVYTRLVDAAQNEGTTPVGWIEQRLPTAECECDKGKPERNVEYLTDERLEQMRKEGKTMRDLLGDLIGCIHSGRGDLRASERHSELFAEGMEEKRRQGRL